MVCFYTFKKLIEEKIQLSKLDQLFLLGDYIDRGPRNREVLDYILTLMDEGYKIYPLIGNHEYFVLRDIEFSKSRSNSVQIRDLVESKDILNDAFEVEPRFVDFINNFINLFI